MVVAVPLPPVVERHQEQVGALQGHKRGPTPVPAGDGVAQRSGEPLQDRRLEQEAADVVGLASQNLLGEIVDDVAVVAGETRDERARIVAPLYGQGRQLQGGDPTLGAPVERRDVALGQRQPHRAVEVGRGLLGGEAQVGGPYLQQVTACAHPRQGERRVDAGGEHHVQLRRPVLEEERQPVVHLGRHNEVQVVEDQHQVPRYPGEVVQQGDERRSVGGGDDGTAAASSCSAPAPTPSTADRIAVTT